MKKVISNFIELIQIFQPGESKTEGCQNCTCTNGRWECEANDESCQNGSCPTGMEWTECKTCQTSCQNMHIIDEQVLVLKNLDLK